MPAVAKFELFEVDLPFRKPFRHAAAERGASQSLFLKCTTDSGVSGFGECLPRAYVTGETQDGAFDLLRRRILPRLVGMDFGSLPEVYGFLAECDGEAPAPWVAPGIPQGSAWCAVDLALLDTFGRQFGEPVRVGTKTYGTDRIRLSAVASAERPWKFALALAKLRLYGFGQVKLKVGADHVDRIARLARRIMGGRCDLRVDANMAWSVDNALRHIRALAAVGVRCVEQPLPAEDLDGLARLVRETGADIIADESFTDRASLERLLQARACTGVNVRISKCGGLLAAARRCEAASRAGLMIQIGCQVGESSLLSAAQLILVSAVDPVRYVEGCYGEHLLHADPGRPLLQLGYGGRAPARPEGPGLGVAMSEARLLEFASRHAIIEDPSR